MKHIKYLIIAFIMIYPSGANAESVNIDTYQADITGDGFVDEIILKGIPFSDDGDYYHHIWAEIKSNDKEWKINYGDGYGPQIQLIDVNHDNVQEILYQSTSRKNKGVYLQKLHSLTKNQLEEMELPELRYVAAKFMDDFKINIIFSPYDKPRKVDVTQRSDMYIQAGLYDENGILNRQKSLLLNSVSYYEPKKLSNQKGYGLKSYKPVNGISPSDQIGIIETLWYYKNGKWIAIQSEWIEA